MILRGKGRRQVEIRKWCKGKTKLGSAGLFQFAIVVEPSYKMHFGDIFLRLKSYSLAFYPKTISDPANKIVQLTFPLDLVLES